ncbi:hypothetical protein F5878DRAFT_12999, partial [Lentinula raphanica]
MNTRLLNQRAETRKSRGKTLASLPGRRLRGPTHGLLGDASSQRDHKRHSTAPTISLLHSQVTTAKKKGASEYAKMSVLNLSTPSIDQEYSLGADPSFSRFSTSSGSDHTDNSNVYNDFRGDPSTFGSYSAAEDDPLESGEGDAADAVQEMKIVYQDFRSRRDRTQVTNEYWVEQMDEIVDAYLDFVWRQESGSPAHEVEGPPMLIEVVDVFGLSQDHCG